MNFFMLKFNHSRWCGDCGIYVFLHLKVNISKEDKTIPIRYSHITRIDVKYTILTFYAPTGLELNAPHVYFLAT